MDYDEEYMIGLFAVLEKDVNFSSLEMAYPKLFAHLNKSVDAGLTSGEKYNFIIGFILADMIHLKALESEKAKVAKLLENVKVPCLN